MPEKGYQLLKDRTEIYGFIFNSQNDSYNQLEKLVKMGSKLMML
tara:strand:- start:115 stop:246 length:132 start_codon:yes stop_codon:yes gene_type:complete